MLRPWPSDHAICLGPPHPLRYSEMLRSTVHSVSRGPSCASTLHAARVVVTDEATDLCFFMLGFSLWISFHSQILKTSMLTQCESWAVVPRTGHSSPSGPPNHRLRHEHISNASNSSQQVNASPNRVPYTYNAMPVLLDTKQPEGHLGSLPRRESLLPNSSTVHLQTTVTELLALGGQIVMPSNPTKTSVHVSTRATRRTWGLGTHRDALRDGRSR